MANTMTINGKTTKTGLIDYIRDSAKSVKDENLNSRISYTLKNVDKVTKSVLYELAKDIMKVLTPVAPLAPVENSPKPKLGKKKVEKEPEIEEPEVEEEDEEAEEPAPKAKKAPVKKQKVKKPEVETTDGLTKKELPMAKIFPKEIDHEALGKLVACPDKYHTMEEIRKALDEGKSLIFACYWAKRHIKEFAYAAVYNVPVPKSGFPFDLDTLQALYVCDGIDALYALSTYTEAMFRIDGEDLEPVESEANDGSKFKLRYSAGLEYEIYEAVDAEADAE